MAAKNRSVYCRCVLDVAVGRSGWGVKIISQRSPVGAGVPGDIRSVWRVRSSVGVYNDPVRYCGMKGVLLAVAVVTLCFLREVGLEGVWNSAGVLRYWFLGGDNNSVSV